MYISKIISTLVISGIIAAGFSSVFPMQAQASSEQQYIVKLKASPEVLSQVADAITLVYPSVAETKFKSIYTFRSSADIATLQQQLAGQYEYLEIDRTFSVGALEASLEPNDPGFSEDETNIDRQWGLHKAEFIEAWERTTGSGDVTVAVIDTGIDMTHEDFDDTSFASGYNAQTEKPIRRGSNSDDNGHGTLVAGVIAATTNNDIGIAGAAWETRLMPVKALSTRGTGSSSDISEAIVWATDNGADIINLSLGGIGFAQDKTLVDAITYAFTKNVVIISAAGNDVAITGGNLDVEPVFPICNDNGQNMIIGVTATDVNDLKPNFANYGKACVDVSAPGKRILSTINHDPASGAESPDSYAYASGTSLAVPYVSAQAALLKSLFPDASNRQIRDRIIATADSVDALNLSQCAGGSCKGLMGGGRINVARSLEDDIAAIQDKDLVQVEGTSELYYINGSKRQLVSSFVRNQRFANATPKVVTRQDLESFPEGSYAEPLNGTLVKVPNEGVVYYIQDGLRLPVTYQVFLLRNLSFATVVTLPDTEVNSWVTGSLLAPPEGTLVRAGNNPTVYWTVNGVLHPINYEFWVNRGLNIFPVVNVSDSDIFRFAKGDPYIL